MRLLIVVVLVLLSACGYTPTHRLPVHSQFIEAGIAPGDEIEIVTKNGEEIAFVVTEVRDDALVGEDVQVAIADIESLAKRSWQKPQHPCGAGRPVGCSMPDVVNAIDDQIAERFAASCIQHDYCYRHGHATYGVDRETCDTEFLDDMRAECGSSGVFDMLSLDGIKQQAECRAMSQTMYHAVRRYGEKAFLTATSTVCPYDEPL